MFRSLTQLSFAAVFAFSAPLVAQESSPETGQPEVSPETSADTGLDLGQPVNEGPKVGDQYSKEKHGDWDLVCLKMETGTDPCSIIQILADPNGNPMAEIRLFRINQPGGQAVAAATVIVPL